MSAGWKPVTRHRKCPHCGHDSWCCIGLRGILCMRMESPWRVTHKDGAVGWFHPFEGPEYKTRPLPARPVMPRPDFRKMIEAWSQETPEWDIKMLAVKLGVAVRALGALGCCWSESHRAWAFPMSDERGDVIGIRLRYDNGSKRAVTGTNGSGLFIPDENLISAQKTLFLTEGPTSTAAALTLGLWAIGRPNNCAGGNTINAFIKRHRVREAVIWADNDKDQVRRDGSRHNPGIEGAHNYAPPCRSTVLLTPAKDARVFLNLGGTAAQLESSLRGVVWRQP